MSHTPNAPPPSFPSTPNPDIVPTATYPISGPPPAYSTNPYNYNVQPTPNYQKNEKEPQREPTDGFYHPICPVPGQELGFAGPQNPYHYGQQAIQMQPMSTAAGSILSGQTVNLNVPQGLEYLTQLDRLYVKQKVECCEVFVGCERRNKYKVKDSQGHSLYTAKEYTDCCTRNCCGRHRSFDIKIKDLNEREIIHLTRPLACGSCWFPCCLQSLEVFSPPGQLAGTVEQQWSILNPELNVKNPLGDTVLKIRGPCCTSTYCGGSVNFIILATDETTRLGKISKKWPGLCKKALTDGDNFLITFPMDLDVRIKAVLLGACFLIDFMYFERTKKRGE